MINNASHKLCPGDSRTYREVRGEAQKAGVGEAFRDMCMSLHAPPDLMSLFLVLKNILYMLSVLPLTWVKDGAFAGWADAATWALSRRYELEQLVGASLTKESIKKEKLGVYYLVHPMLREGLRQYALFAAMCTAHELDECKDLFAFTQAQALFARYKELEKQKWENTGNYVEQYEAHAGAGDFARKVRSPYPMALALREISGAGYAALLKHLHPERSPDLFAKSFTERDMPIGKDYVPVYRVIRHYCELKSSSRTSGLRQAGEGHGGGAVVNGHIEYNEFRFGTISVNGDPDEWALDVSDQELIGDRTVDVVTALSEDVDPRETATAGFVLQEDLPGCGSDPRRAVRSRTSVHMLNIDKSRMPWSAIHLRPREIEGSLLAAMRTVAKRPHPETETALAQLEMAALIAISIETSRPLVTAFGIRSSAVPEGEITFIPGDAGSPSHWCLKAIEPLYQAERPTIPQLEVSRVSYLLYPVHPVADELLRSLASTRRSTSPLFSKPLDVYEKRVKIWLRELDSTGRLTLAKIARLKGSLIAQANGGDFAISSLVLGVPHPMARVPLFYSLLPVEIAISNFQCATAVLWNALQCDKKAKYEVISK